jgi:Fe-S cluster biogenesis protein NfuA
MTSNEFQEKTAEIDGLVQRVNNLSDEEARTAALELLQSMMDLHGAALSRIVEVLSSSGEAGRTSLAKLGQDPLISGLLVLYELHPVALEDRVKRAVEKARGDLRKQGAKIELTGIAETVVHVRIENTGHTCGSSADTLRSLVEQAILEAAPEVVQVVTEGLPVSGTGFVPLSTIQPASAKEQENYEKSTA